MKNLALSMILCLACSGSALAQHTVEIKGKVKFIEGDFKISAFQRDGFDKKNLAETTVNPADNTYRLTVSVEKPGSVTIDCGHWQEANVWVEDENMEIDFRGMDTAKIKIKNPPYLYIKG